MILKQGDIIPADCLLIDGDELLAEEVLITGSFEHVRKSVFIDDNYPSDPFLLSESRVIRGRGIGLVCAVGENT